MYESFLDHLWIIEGMFRDDLGIIQGSFEDFSIDLGSLTVHSGSSKNYLEGIKGSLGNHFWLI